MKHRLTMIGAGLGLAIAVGAGSAAASEGDGKIGIHGYGELHYNSPKSGSSVPAKDAPAAMDMHRMVWGLSYQISDSISLHTEVDFEHGAQEMELEYAYLDFVLDPLLNVRAGAVLMPVGPLNEYHEPTLFYSVERPYVQNVIIPTTWGEGGAGFFGSIVPGLRYRVYVVAGLAAEEFSASGGLRGGRGKVAGGSGSVAKVPPQTGEKLAYVGRVEYVGLPGLSVGASGYTGGANQKDSAALNGVNVYLVEGDLKFRLGPIELSGLYAQIKVMDAHKITKKSCTATAPAGGGPVTDVCTTSPAKIGETMVGWYGEAAIHLLPIVMPDSEQDVVAFVRWEAFNTQEEVPSNYTADPANDRTVLTYGVAYFPHPDVAVKVDQERWEDDADNKEQRINVGVAYMF